MSTVVALISNIIAMTVCAITAFLVESKFERAINACFALANAIFVGVNLMRL